ncbi:hypothetical protein MXB_1854, partial [Myxobolus squamalis]
MEKNFLLTKDTSNILNLTFWYFGAARDLPGVRELFEQEPPAEKKKKRAVYKGVDAHYFGYLDEDDDRILELENQAEIKGFAFFRLIARELS